MQYLWIFQLLSLSMYSDLQKQESMGWQKSCKSFYQKVRLPRNKNRATKPCCIQLFIRKRETTYNNLICIHCILSKAILPKCTCKILDIQFCIYTCMEYKEMSLSYTNPQHAVKQWEVMQTFLTLLLVQTMFIRKREFWPGYFLGQISVIPWVSFISPVKCSWVFFYLHKMPIG